MVDGVITRQTKTHVKKQTGHPTRGNLLWKVLMVFRLPNGSFEYGAKYIHDFQSALPDYSTRAIERALNMLVQDRYLRDAYTNISEYEKRVGPTDHLVYVPGWHTSWRSHGIIKDG